MKAAILLLVMAIAVAGALLFLRSGTAADKPPVLVPLNFDSEKGPPPPTDDPHAEAKAILFAAMNPLDEKGFMRKAAPQKGEWLARFSEQPQSLERYKNAKRVRPVADRRTIVLQPLGAFNDEQRKVLEAMRAYAEVFFQHPTRIAADLPLTDYIDEEPIVRPVDPARRHGVLTRQYDGDLILRKLLQKKLPKDAMIYLGITMEDLWAGNLNYIFGLGSLKDRVGCYSLCRYFPEFWGQPRKDGDDILALRRSCKVLNHEAGHMFGLTHCVFYECSMNGSNSLDETDKAPIHFCPLCHQKLKLNLTFEPLKRYEALREFYTKHKLTPEATWLATRIENWKDLTQRPNE